MTAGVRRSIARPFALAMLACALAPAAGLAQTASDEVVSTAQAGPGAPQTPASPAIKTNPRAKDDPSSDEPLRDRQIHGEVSVGVGTNGYRRISGVVEGPVGDNGQVMIAVDAGRMDAPRR